MTHFTVQEKEHRLTIDNSSSASIRFNLLLPRKQNVSYQHQAVHARNDGVNRIGKCDSSVRRSNAKVGVNGCVDRV